MVGICLYALLSYIGLPSDESDLAELYGTIGHPAGEEPGYAMDPFEFNLAEVRGKTRFQCTSSHIFVNVNLVANKEVELIMEYGKELRFEGFRALDISDHDVAITGNRVALGHDGVSDYIVVFEKTSPSQADITFKIFSGGDLIFEETAIPRQK